MFAITFVSNVPSRDTRQRIILICKLQVALWRFAEDSLCKHKGRTKCQWSTLLGSPSFPLQLARFRMYWRGLSKTKKTNALLRGFSISTEHEARMSYSFLGTPLCNRAWRRVTHIHPYRALKGWKNGARDAMLTVIHRPCPASDEVRGALAVFIR